MSRERRRLDSKTDSRHMGTEMAKACLSSAHAIGWQKAQDEKASLLSLLWIRMTRSAAVFCDEQGRVGSVRRDGRLADCSPFEKYRLWIGFELQTRRHLGVGQGGTGERCA